MKNIKSRLQYSTLSYVERGKKGFIVSSSTTRINLHKKYWAVKAPMLEENNDVRTKK